MRCLKSSDKAGRREQLIDADVAELADALDLGSSVHDVQVQVLLSAVHLGNKEMSSFSECTESFLDCGRRLFLFFCAFPCIFYG